MSRRKEDGNGCPQLALHSSLSQAQQRALGATAALPTTVRVTPRHHCVRMQAWLPQAVTQHCALSSVVLMHATCWIPTNTPVGAVDAAAAALHFGFNSSHMVLQTNDEELIEKHPEKNQDYAAD